VTGELRFDGRVAIVYPAARQIAEESSARLDGHAGTAT